MGTETTHVRIAKATNDRVKAILDRAGSRLGIAECVDRLLNEALDLVESENLPESPGATIADMRKRLARPAAQVISAATITELFRKLAEHGQALHRLETLVGKGDAKAEAKKKRS